MNLPNILTAIRILLIPIFGYCLFVEKYIAAAILFLAGGITDILDGHIARKYNLVTSFGKLADPLADKLMQLTALAILTFLGKIELIVLILILAKEFLMILGSVLLYKRKNFVVSANWYGKLATVIFYLAIVLIIFNSPYGHVFIIAAVLFALFAFIMYARNFKKINKSLNH
ncbi:MAG TPA: CDP-alcohol phosphatidyltransferase family protein [Clostridiaceae bacterium]|nr:CDP-alcohol phosphatidyltransferase family protein [Clostridiaceae bacterium]